jgi:hypothetical protein
MDSIETEETRAAAALVIPKRFCGPPGAGNGGYVAGSLAAYGGAGRPLEVTLRRPTPLEQPLAVRRRGEPGAPCWTLEGGDGTLLAEARPVDAFDAEPPVLPAGGALETVPPHEHPFPGCFVCGPARAPGDGLRLFAAPLRGSRTVAAPWRPSADLADGPGAVDARFVWAALDCPGYFAAIGPGPARPLLLGRIAASIEAPVAPGEACTVLAWPLAHDGRRHQVATALVDASGRVRARSQQLWVEPRPAPAAIDGRLRAVV